MSTAESGDPEFVFFGNNRVLHYVNLFYVYLLLTPILSLTRIFTSAYDVDGGSNVILFFSTINTDVLDIDAHSGERMEKGALSCCLNEVHSQFSL